jgi:dynein heavy chain
MKWLLLVSVHYKLVVLIINKTSIHTNRLDWTSAKLVLGDTDFLKRLQGYEKDKISDALLKKLKEYVEHPDFVPEKVATQSKVCKSMCMWVRAVDMYAKIYRVVEPKKKRFVLPSLHLIHDILFTL